VLDWNDLRYFLAVARRGSVTAAASELSVNHSTVSRRLSALEKRLGVRLFDRTAGGYQRTSAGEDMFETAHRVEEEVLGLDRRVSGRDSRLSGTIRFSAPDTLVMHLLIPHIAAFHEAYPDVELQIVASNQLMNLTKREADVVLRVSNAPPENLIGRRLATMPFAIFASKEYLESRDVSDPTTLEWIGFDQDGAPEWVKKHFPGSQLAVRFDDLPGILRAAQAGMGLAHMPCFLCKDDPNMRKVGPEQTDFSMEMWLLTHEDLRASARIRTFLDFMASALTGERDRLELP
jgi:DNA-binding transcriptional LysR family regulator